MRTLSCQSYLGWSKVNTTSFQSTHTIVVREKKTVNDAKQYNHNHSYKNYWHCIVKIDKQDHQFEILILFYRFGKLLRGRLNIEGKLLRKKLSIPKVIEGGGQEVIEWENYWGRHWKPTYKLILPTYLWLMSNNIYM